MKAIFENKDIKKVNKYFAADVLEVEESDGCEDIEYSICKLMEKYGYLTATELAEAERKLEYVKEDGQELYVRDGDSLMFTVNNIYYELKIDYCFYDAGSEDYCYIIAVKQA